MPLVEHVDAALDAGERLDALALEADQHASSVLIGAATHLARLGLGLLEQLAGALLGRTHELTLLEHLRSLLLGSRDDRVALVTGALGDATGFFGDASRLPNLVRHRRPELVDQLEYGRLVEHDVVRQGQALAGRHQRFEPLDQEDDVRGAPLLAGDYTRGSVLSRSVSAAATGPGTIGLMSPPKRATSLVRDELT